MDGWGYYKLIPGEDDFSRKIIAHDVRPDKTAFFLSDILEMGLENARREGYLTGNEPMPQHHPQGRGKIERFNRRIKEKLCLVVYYSPDELKRVVEETIATYNRTPLESLDNVSPNDVYAGRKEAILQRRKEKKRLTLERRK